MRFHPQALDASPGDTIVWINKDLVPHTATSKNGSFDSKMIPANATWKYLARTKGTFAYTCTYHPTMNASVRVR